MILYDNSDIKTLRSSDCQERAFMDQDNFVHDSNGKDIPGNRGAVWSKDNKALW